MSQAEQQDEEELIADPKRCSCAVQHFGDFGALQHRGQRQLVLGEEKGLEQLRETPR